MNSQRQNAGNISVSGEPTTGIGLRSTSPTTGSAGQRKNYRGEMKVESEKLTYSVRQAAVVIGCSLPIMYQLCARPGFPAIRISEKRIVIPRAALEIWLESQVEAGR